MNHKQLEEDYIIYEDEKSQIQVWNYLYGSCHLFALELSSISKLKIGAFIDSEDEGDIYLQHAFCYHPTDQNLIIDCRGILEKETALTEYTSDALNHEEISDARNFIENSIKNGKFHNWESDIIITESEPSFVKNEKQILHNFIQQKIKDGIYPELKKNKIKMKLK